MTDEELERLCFLLGSAIARQNLRIKVLRAYLLKTGLVEEANLAQVERLADEEQFQVLKGRYIRMLRAVWKEEDPDQAMRAWLDGLARQ